MAEDDIDPEVWQTEAIRRLAEARTGNSETAVGLFQETRQILARLIREERAIASETGFYKSRLEELRRVVPVGAELRAAIERAAAIDARLAGLRSEVSALRRRRRELVETLSALTAKLEAELRAKAAETDRNVKAIASEVEAERTRRVTLARDFGTQAGTRQATITKLENELKAREKT